MSLSSDKTAKSNIPGLAERIYNELKQDIYTKQLRGGMGALDTVCIFSDIEFSHISSTDIRGMEKLEVDSAKNLYFK